MGKYDLLLYLIRLVPVPPDAFGVHLAQAPILAYLRPGQWLAYLVYVVTGRRGHVVCPRSAGPERWVVRSGGSSAAKRPEQLAQLVGQILARCESVTEQVTKEDHPNLRGALFINKGTTPRKDGGGRFVAWYFTPGKRWLDVIEINITPLYKGGEEEALSSSSSSVVCEARSCSTGCVPAALPIMGILMSILLWWIPFNDMGQNQAHLDTLRALLEEDDGVAEVRVEA